MFSQEIHHSRSGGSDLLQPCPAVPLIGGGSIPFPTGGRGCSLPTGGRDCSLPTGGRGFSFPVLFTKIFGNGGGASSSPATDHYLASRRRQWRPLRRPFPYRRRPRCGPSPSRRRLPPWRLEQRRGPQGPRRRSPTPWQHDTVSITGCSPRPAVTALRTAPGGSSGLLYATNGAIV